MLRKAPATEVIPGTPAVSYRPEQTVCVPATPPSPGGSPDGEWRLVCTTIALLVGWDEGPASFGNPGPFPKPIYSNELVCRSEWVPG